MFESEEGFAQHVQSKGGCAYLVGGAVRDEILGYQPKDRDYVIAGLSAEDMAAFECVGSSFPVFLVEIAGEQCEVALARKERKIGAGHRGFEVQFDSGVTIEEDLGRRDFTINAIARNLLTGEYVDPFGGKKQLESKGGGIIQALSSAFTDDPLRVLRAARFAAILGMSISEETIDMMRQASPSLKELPKERIFQELKTVLLRSRKPSLFFRALKDADCLSPWFVEVENLIGVAAGPAHSKHGAEDSFDHAMDVLDRYAGKSAESRFACLCHDFGKALPEEPPKHHGHEKVGVPLVNDFCARLNVPNSFKKSALCFTLKHMTMHRILEVRCGKAARLALEAEKGMAGGIDEFLRCSVADGMSEEYALNILRKSHAAFAVRLPAQHIGKGSACHEIMENLRGKAWRNS
jgi:tRNA nucleotidyltransferase (CCA-adding enzyme)